MFLSLLNTDQKKMFISLAYNIAMLDGDFCEKEKSVFESYFVELQMKVLLDEVDNDIDHIISELNANCGIREKRIIIFEIIGMAMADYNYDNAEKEIVCKALNVFGLDKEFGDFCEKKLFEYLNLQEELNSRILS